MADTITTYKRGSQASDQISKTRVPGSGGMRALAAAERQYIAGIDAFAKAGGRLANSYFTALENREARDADTYASKVFRDRRIEVLQTVKGKDADGLLDRESAWSDEQFETFVEQYDIGMVKAEEIWRRHKDTYLDRTGAYMIEQQAAYDKQSRLAASNSANDDLVGVKIGDIAALNQVFAKNSELFEHDPVTAEKQNDKAIMAAVGAWARQNPRATVEWFNQNKEALKEQFGAKFLNVSDVVDRAQAKIEQEVRHAEVLAQRAERITRQQKTQYSEQVLSNFVTLAVRGEADASALYALTDDPNVSSTDKLQAFNLAKGIEKSYQVQETAKGKATQEATESQLVARAFTDDESTVRTSAIEALKNGNITPEGFNNVLSNMEKARAIPASARPFLTDAYSMVEDVYADTPSGMMQDPRSKDQYNKIRNAVTQRASDHPESIAADMNQNNPNSWIRQLLMDNPPLKRSIAISFGAQFDPANQTTITVPGLTRTKESVINRPLTLKERLDQKHRSAK